MNYTEESSSYFHFSFIQVLNFLHGIYHVYAMRFLFTFFNFVPTREGLWKNDHFISMFSVEIWVGLWIMGKKCNISKSTSTSLAMEERKDKPILSTHNSYLQIFLFKVIQFFPVTFEFLHFKFRTSMTSQEWLNKVLRWQLLL